MDDDLSPKKPGRRLRRRTRWAAFAIVLALALGVQSVRAYRHGKYAADVNTRPPREAVVRPLGETAAALQDVSFPSAGASRITLRGWYVPSRNGAAVVFVHGYGGNRTALWPEASLLIARGYGALLFDLRASGASDGDRVTFGDGERDDVEAAVDFVAHEPDVQRGKIGVFAFSMGGWAAAPVAAADARVRALVLAGVTSSFEDQRAEGFGLFSYAYFAGQDEAMRRLGIDLSRARALDFIARLAPRPVLLMRGSDDTTVPARWMDPLLAAAGEPKELYTVAGAGHGGYFAAGGAAYAQKIEAFFDHALSPSH